MSSSYYTNVWVSQYKRTSTTNLFCILKKNVEQYKFYLDNSQDDQPITKHCDKAETVK